MIDYRKLLNHIDVEVLAIDPREYTILAVSRGFLVRRKLRKPEVVGRKCHEVLHQPPSPCDEGLDFVCPMKEALRKKKTVSINHAHTHEDGKKFIVNIRIIPVLSDQ